MNFILIKSINYYFMDIIINQSSSMIASFNLIKRSWVMKMYPHSIVQSRLSIEIYMNKNAVLIIYSIIEQRKMHLAEIIFFNKNIN